MALKISPRRWGKATPNKQKKKNGRRTQIRFANPPASCRSLSGRPGPKSPKSLKKVSWGDFFQTFFGISGFQSFLEVFRTKFSEVSRGFSEAFRVFRGFQRSSQRPSQRQLSEALSPVAPHRVAPWTFLQDEMSNLAIVCLENPNLLK